MYRSQIHFLSDQIWHCHVSNLAPTDTNRPFRNRRFDALRSGCAASSSITAGSRPTAAKLAGASLCATRQCFFSSIFFSKVQFILVKHFVQKLPFVVISKRSHVGSSIFFRSIETSLFIGGTPDLHCCSVLVEGVCVSFVHDCSALLVLLFFACCFICRLSTVKTIQLHQHIRTSATACGNGRMH